MPQSPDHEIGTAPSPFDPPQLRNLFRMLHSGRSFSGRERKCLYLNTGGARWACVSAAAGVDFPDDGRAVGAVDWDQDGDVDLWIANRSGPQVRFLRNDAPGMGHALDLRLVGTKSNRDGIGARVEIRLAGGDKRIKTLHAGEGYLAQSSKMVHFGLGAATAVEQVTVRWPGGTAEEFGGCAADARYVLRQGAGKAEALPRPARAVALAPSTLDLATGSLAGRSFLAARVPMPSLSYMDFQGGYQAWPKTADGPLLVNLWASWCKPCLAELKTFGAEEKALHAAGLRILALSVNGLGRDGKGTPAAAQAAIAEAKFPFASGRATAELLDKLELLNVTLFSIERPMPVPTSLLVDAQGRLAAIYRGPVDVPTLLADVANLPAEGEKLRALATPFPGRWRIPPPKAPLRQIAERFLDERRVEDGIMYLEAAVAASPEDGIVQYNLAEMLGSQGKWQDARPHFQKAFDLLPNEPLAHYGLAKVLMQLGRVQEALPLAEETVRMRSDFAGGHNQLGSVFDRLGRLDPAADEFRKAIELQPEDREAFNNLGIVYAKQGKMAEAEAQHRKALAIDPRWADAHYALGRVLAIEDKLEEALHEFEETARLQPNYPMEMGNIRRIQEIVERRRRGGGR